MKHFKKITKIASALALAITLAFTSITPTFAAGKHNVAFVYGTKQCIVTVDDGCNALPPSDTYVPGYTFAGWVGNANNVTEDRVILGAYIKADPPAPAVTPAPAPAPVGQTYRVHFIDGLTGAEYYGQTVSEGADANPPEVPHHDGYHFAGYDGSYTNVTSEHNVTALYEQDTACYHDDPSDWWWNWDDLDNYNYYQNNWWS